METMNETSLLICDYVLHCLIKNGYSWPQCPPMVEDNSRCRYVLRLLCDEFQRRYSDIFLDMTANLPEDTTMTYATFKSICLELFGGTDMGLEVKWSRIVAMYAFAGAIAVYWAEHGMIDRVNEIKDWIDAFTRDHLVDWIVSHGGWVSEMMSFDCSSFF